MAYSDERRIVGEETPRLLVGDRLPMVAAALSALLTAQGQSVVACVTNGAAAAAAILSGGIDIAILDIEMEGPSPLKLLARRAPRVAVIVTAPSADHHLVGEAIAAGVDGLVLKTEPGECLRHCITAVSMGGRWHDRGATARARDRNFALGAAELLTRRERDVARLVATGQRNRIIAGHLGISEGTVKMHLHNVYAKLGLESRTQLAMDERLRMLG